MTYIQKMIPNGAPEVLTRYVATNILLMMSFLKHHRHHHHHRAHSATAGCI